MMRLRVTDHEPTANRSVDAPQATDHRAATVLVVDDQEENLEVTTAVLATEGFQAVWARTGREALALATAQPDLIILDVHLPDLDGFEVCRRLKSRPATAAIPVLCLSGVYRRTEDRVRGLDGGADGYLTKPAAPEELLATTRALLRQRAEAGRAGARAQATTQALAQVSRHLAGEFDPAQTAHATVTTVQRLFGVRRTAFYAVDPSGGALTCVAAAGDDDPGTRLGQAVRGVETAAAHVVLRGGSLASADVLADPWIALGDPLREDLRTAGYGALAGVPLTCHGEVLGVLALADRPGRVFTAEDLGLLAAFADQAALALQNARLYQRAEARAEKLTTLSALTRLITSAADSEQVFDSVARAAVMLLGARAARVWGDDPAHHVLRPCGSFALDPTLGQLMTDVEAVAYGQGMVGRIFASRAPAYLADAQQDPRWQNRRLVTEGGLHAYAGIPLIAGERTVGVLSVLFGERRELAPEEKTLLRLLADQAAIVIERTRLFEDLKTSYEELERTQTQLVQAQKMEAVGQLAGGVAHDFNNLLTVIAGRCELLLRRLAADGPQRRDVTLIQETAGRAGVLTRQLLAFSQKGICEPEVLNLNAVLPDLTALLRRMIGEHIDLVFEPDPDVGWITTDPVQLEQVIINLVVNARDAMPSGGRLVLGTRNVEVGAPAAHHAGIDAGAYVQLSVQDTGTGMDAATRARIFEPFFTTKGPGKGTGLGLAVVSRIVEQSAGHIEVDSAPGRGTTFTIHFPRVEKPHGTVGQDLAAGPARGTEVILMVEDDDGVRALAREGLESYGYTVLEARHAAEALAIAERDRRPIQLLITDVVMPDRGGPQLAARLTAQRPEMSVLYVSGYPGDALVETWRSDPAVAFLPKPFTPAGLARKVRDLLGPAASTAPQESRP